MLGKKDIQFYWENGYLVIPDIITNDELSAIEKEVERLSKDFIASQAGIYINGYNMKGDDYYLGSADKVRHFLEEDAVNEKGELVFEDKTRGLHKLAHGLHQANPVFRDFTMSSKFAQILKDLGYSKPAVVQGMYLFKHPKIGCEFKPHQDATYLYNEPPKSTGFWIPIEDATEENGCLWFIPGSHKGDVDIRYIWNPDPTGPKLTYTADTLPKYDDSNFVPCPVKRGSCLLIDTKVVHKSSKNNSEKRRPVYTFHTAETVATVYSPLNWLQNPPGRPFPLYDMP